MNTNEVRVLKHGYTVQISPSQLRADGTITLIKSRLNVLVDTGGPWDRDFLLSALEAHGVKPQDISFVVCTHGHSDHTGNTNLFPGAVLISSHDISKDDLYTVHDFAKPYIIDDGIEVIATPGHTQGDVSVIVRTKDGIVAITGDLFENEADLTDDSLWKATSELPKEQQLSRNRVLKLANFIVPGHGDIFAVYRFSAD
ncbi:MAG: MBL fold metallo-hydrolase [Armatimonadota bacterium]